MRPPIAVTLHMDERKLPAQVFGRIAARMGTRRNRRAAAREAWENFGKPGRDPNRLDGVMALLATDAQWVPHLRIAQLRNHWDQVVGGVIASHSFVDGLADGVLSVRAESGVWATQLTYMIPQMTAAIRERVQGLDIREVRVTGPRARSLRRNAMGRRIQW